MIPVIDSLSYVFIGEFHLIQPLSQPERVRRRRRGSDVANGLHRLFVSPLFGLRAGPFLNVFEKLHFPV